MDFFNLKTQHLSCGNIYWIVFWLFPSFHFLCSLWNSYFLDLWTSWVGSLVFWYFSLFHSIFWGNFLSFIFQFIWGFHFRCRTWTSNRFCCSLNVFLRLFSSTDSFFPVAFLFVSVSFTIRCPRQVCGDLCAYEQCEPKATRQSWFGRGCAGLLVQWAGFSWGSPEVSIFVRVFICDFCLEKIF